MFRSASDKLRPPIKSRSVVKRELSNIYCDMCTAGPWLTGIEVDIHRRSVHKQELLRLLADPEAYMCGVCLHPQKDKRSLVNHMKTVHFLSKKNSTHLNHEIFICDVCGNLFYNKLLLTAHMLFSHLTPNVKESKSKIECPKCFKMVRVKFIWFHLVQHDLMNTNSCPICLECFDWNLDLVQHINLHFDYLFCGICGYETKNEVYFENHIKKHKKHTNNILKNSKQDVSKYFGPINCNFVGWLKKGSSMLKGMTLPETLRICLMCRAIFENTDEDGMLLHILGDHAEEPEPKTSYTCVCGDSFTNKVMLKHHVFKMKGDHKAIESKPMTDFDRIMKEEKEITDVKIVNMPEVQPTEVACKDFQPNSTNVTVTVLKDVTISTAAKIEPMDI